MTLKEISHGSGRALTNYYSLVLQNGSGREPTKWVILKTFTWFFNVLFERLRTIIIKYLQMALVEHLQMVLIEGSQMIVILASRFLPFSLSLSLPSSLYSFTSPSLLPPPLRYTVYKVFILLSPSSIVPWWYLAQSSDKTKSRVSMWYCTVLVKNPVAVEKRCFANILLHPLHFLRLFCKSTNVTNS